MVLFLIGRYPTLDLTMKLVMRCCSCRRWRRWWQRLPRRMLARAIPSRRRGGARNLGSCLRSWAGCRSRSTAIWHSIWTRALQADRARVHGPPARFNFGGLATAVAIIFLTLGAGDVRSRRGLRLAVRDSRAVHRDLHDDAGAVGGRSSPLRRSRPCFRPPWSCSMRSRVMQRSWWRPFGPVIGNRSPRACVCSMGRRAGGAGPHDHRAAQRISRGWWTSRRRCRS